MFCPVRWLQLSIILLYGSLLWSDTAGFDLAGPRIELRVTRAGKTLPISRVPNLQAGDRLWIHPDMPLVTYQATLLKTRLLDGE